MTRPCLDWSGRHYHLAGAAGAALAARLLALGWISRVRESRADRLSGAGRAGLHREVGVHDPATSVSLRSAGSLAGEEAPEADPSAR